jgi:exoribonuclease-2
MYVLFEEDGAFKAGSVLAENEASLQVETTHGKRLKLKANHVLMHFREPDAGRLLDAAEREAESLDTELLWEVCGEEEFAFPEFAAEYYGRVAGPVESAAVLLRLHSAPIYFHRKGRGRFRKAPPDILQAALAGLEKKRQQAELVERMRAELVAGQLPAEFADMLPQILYRPDRNRLEVKALEAACVDSGLSAPRLPSRSTRW